MSRSCVARIGITLLALTALLSPASCAVRGKDGPQADQFVKRVGAELRLGDKPFRFAGTNNYYLMYKPQAMVDDVLNAAAANGFAVVRTWGFLDIGNQDDSNSIKGK